MPHKIYNPEKVKNKKRASFILPSKYRSKPKGVLCVLLLVVGLAGGALLYNRSFAAGPITFRDVTQEVGLINPLVGAYVHTAAWGDYNNDGWEDLFVGMFTHLEDSYYQFRGATGPISNRIITNNQGTFQKANQPNIEIFARSSGSVFADLDNDGDQDLIVLNYRKDDQPTQPGREPNRMYRNDSGTYIDVSVSSGIQLSAQVSRGVGVLDYNSDGLQDIIILADDADPRLRGQKVRLYRNNGNLRFEDVSVSAGLPQMNGYGIATGDLNGDGWTDFFIGGGPHTNPRRNYLYINNRNGTFHEANPGGFTWTGSNSTSDLVTGVSFGDVNRDGRTDIFVGHHYQSASSNNPVAPRLYLNRGNNAAGDPLYDDITTAAGLRALPSKLPHVEIQDFDNDGWPDLYLSVKINTPNGAMPMILKNNGVNSNGIPTFTYPSYTGGITYYPGGPTVDYDHDGRLDIFFDEFRPQNPPPLFRNTTTSDRWLQVKVTDPKNTQGLNAKVKVYKAGQVGNSAGLLGSYDISVGYGYSSSPPPVAHFGMGAETTVDIQVTMPNGGITFTKRSVATNQRTVLVANDTPPSTDTTAPSLPVNLTATPGNTQAAVGWTASTDNVGVTGYDLRHRPTGTTIWTTVSASGTTHTVTGLTNGTSYDFQVRAKDAAGNLSAYTASATATPTAPPVADTQAPVAALTSPAAGSTVSGTVTVSGTATDNVGVSRVEVYRGQTLLGTATRSGTATNSTWIYAWNTDGLNQLVNLTARAYDAAGNVGTSTVVQVTVNNTAAPALGDVNGDGSVNALDLSAILTNYGRTGATRAQGDVNGDGTVNALDLSQVLARYGN